MKKAIVVSLILLAGFVGIGAATKTINTNATGGDCASFGTWDGATNTCTMTADLAEGVLINSKGVTLDGNGHSLIDSGSRTGVNITEDKNNNITVKNLNIRNFYYGIYVSSNHNTLVGNTITGNTYGLYLDSRSSNNNKIYNNNFLNNTHQAYASSSNNAFNLSAPTGGNYWSDYDTPAKGCNNADGNSFCDAPYNFTGGRDYLPWTRQNGWLDSIAPTTNYSISGTLGNNGWYVSDVNVTLTAADNEGGSGVANTEYKLDGGNWVAYTAPIGISTEGTTTVYYRSTDNAGNVEDAQSITIKIDKTAPAITGSRTPDANDYGWNNENVTVHFECTDSVSGVSSVTDDQVVSTEGANQSASGTCTDNAGNSADAAVGGISIDWTAPTAETDVPRPNENGWYNADVSARVLCSDTGSGVTDSFFDVFFNLEEANQSQSRTCTDLAGNTADGVISGINIDKTAPTITGSRTPGPNTNGWNNENVTVHFACSDSLSGVNSSTADQVVSTNGANQSVDGMCADNAGNSNSTTVSGISIDKTVPTATTEVPAANTNGWYNTDVTARVYCDDALSGVTDSFFDVFFNLEKANQSQSRTCTDLAGNTADGVISGINIDKTAPSITYTRTPDANIYGWNNGSVTVTFSGTDDLSGVDTVTGDATVSSEGFNQSVTGTVTDKAGNSNSITVSGINIDKTAPLITGAATTPPNVNGWYNADVTVAFTASDSGSGIASVTPDTTLSAEAAGQSVTGTAVDLAGNTATFTVSGINIDLTAPVITINAPANGSTYTLNQAVLADWSADGSISGIASESGVPSGSAIDTSSVGTKSFTVSATDKAGNTAASTVTYTVTYRYGGVLAPITADGKGLFKLGSTIPVKFQLTDANGNFVSTATAHLFITKTGGSEMAATSTSGATIGNLFRYDYTSNQYVFNLATKTLSTGTWQIRILLDDGTSKHASFSLK